MAKQKKNKNKSINGFTITEKQHKELQRLTRNANAKRQRQLNRYMDTLNNVRGYENVSSLHRAEDLENRGFLTEKYSTNLKQFNSKEDFKAHMEGLRSVNRPNYNKSKINRLRKDMELNIFRKTDDDTYKRLRYYTDEEILSIYLNMDYVNEPIWDSDQKLDTEDWKNKITGGLDYFDRRLPKQRQTQLLKKRGY